MSTPDGGRWTPRPAYSDHVAIHPRYDAAHVFRLALADALTQAGPDARTLCTGWTTADLAAHLYVRENDPLSLPGIAGLPGPAGPAAQRLTTRSMERALTHHGYQGVVDLFRAGPRPWSVWRAPQLDRIGNALEYFVHLHDVTDAVPHGGNDPVGSDRGLSQRLRDELWHRMPPLATMLLRGSPAGVQLERLDAPHPSRIIARRGLPIVTARGSAPQLALWMFGRHARVELVGDVEPLAAVSTLVASGV